MDRSIILVFEPTGKKRTNDMIEFVIATVNRKKLLAKSNLEATFKLIDKVKLSLIDILGLIKIG